MDYDPDHSHNAFIDMCQLNSAGQCQMNGADLVPITCNKGATDCPAPDLAFGYVNPADVQPYFQMAEQYTFADHMFQTNQGPSMPAHQFIISGTSAPSTGSNLFAAENPKTSAAPDAGCDAPAGSTVALIDPTGSETSNAPIFPCFEHKTLTDLLEAKGNTWRYYAPSGYVGGSAARKRSSISADRSRDPITAAGERIGPTMWSSIKRRSSPTLPRISCRT